jgi:hypothetical protein
MSPKRLKELSEIITGAETISALATQMGCSRIFIMKSLQGTRRVSGIYAKRLQQLAEDRYTEIGKILRKV